MSMNMLTLLQLTGIFCAYLLVTLGLPAFVLERKLQVQHRLTERVLIYFMLGNFYIMNLVFVLQLLKISNFFTLILGTLAPTVWAWVAVNKVPVKIIFRKWAQTMRRVSAGLMGWKTLTLHIWVIVKQYLFRFGRMMGRFLFRRTLDTFLVLAMSAALFYIYGSNIFQYYGYKASDLLVHNYWINAMNDNHIFVAGVYPHGFHCIVYYLHAVFGFDTYVILRIFAFPQNVMIHIMLFAFLKLCCKSKYMAYLGTFLYILGGFFAENTYARYYATLPQEFGMLFILPAVYFGFAYFAARKDELAEEILVSGGKKISRRERKIAEKERKASEKGEKGSGKRKKSHLYLAEFAMSFSMTLAVHFYGTMIAGLFCAAMALGYGFLFFRKKYFREVVCTCAISVAIAVMPMLLAFLGGTPLQGSLGWGLNVITGGNNRTTSTDNSDTAGKEEDGSQAGVSVNAGDGAQGGASGSGANSTQGGASGSGGNGTQTGASGSGENSTQAASDGGQMSGEAATTKVSFGEKLQNLAVKVKDKLISGWRDIYRAINASVLRIKVKEGTYGIMCAFLGLIVLGLVYFLLKQNCYGAMLISTGIYMFFISIMMTARSFGLPPLMDNNRGSIYFAYSLPIVVSFAADAVLNFCFLPMKRKYVMNFLSFVCVVLAMGYLWQEQRFKRPRNSQAQIMNENIVCLTNIIKSEEDYTWTIVSANDETQMGIDHGYHYETIVFLEAMEESVSQAMIRIPTNTVYFFIEKCPVDYSIRYAESGQYVSEEGAANPLPANSGIEMYQGEKRWIVMSRMYYWAQEFQRLYPNEMEVYLETDQFVCYRIEQNPYRLYNFAIDYGYNMAGEAAESL